ncbi:hypothetical protein CHISP_2393 [Chitinispirillum alkaliphilum]|nr:hypothetical protein CHISP_2393 [Chitinispirillum alkaliphilum]
MATAFLPIENPSIYCRFCNKIVPMQLDRSIAENGKTVDRKSTFEYCCSKCLKTVCFSGNDLQEKCEDTPQECRTYAPKESFYIGEQIFHQKFNETGLIVGKESGSPEKILVQFEKAGLVKLIQNI